MRFVAGKETVVDTRSGLMWTRDAAPETYPQTWPEALACVRQMNQQGFCGHSDWRLPNRRELFSLVSHAAVNPALPEGHPFANAFSGYYWSSTTCVRLPQQAWYVHLGGARVFTGMKQGSCMVWPVRTAHDLELRVHRTGQKECFDQHGARTPCSGSGQDAERAAGRPWPWPRFEAVDGGIRDRMTGRIWRRTADCTGSPVSWEEAHAAVRAANAGTPHGAAPWRLPGVRELESLCDLGAHTPALPRAHPFERVRPFYWSATTSRYDERYAWVLYLQDGAVGVGYKPLAEFFVWLVRGGKEKKGGGAF